MIPKYYEIPKPMLEYLKDGKIHSKKEIVDYLANYFQVTDEEKNQLLPSGAKAFRSTVGWVKKHLLEAKLLDAPQKAHVVITERGLNFLDKIQKEGKEIIKDKDLMRFKEFVEFRKRKNKKRKNRKRKEEKTVNKSSKETPAETSDKTPDETPNEATDKALEEALTNKVKEINNYLKDELLKRILNASPQFFEHMVIDLISKMGYGGSFEEASKLLGKSGDEGVDGLIKEDILGLDNVYLQAKRWNKGTIGRPEIQSFVGALHGKGAKKGIFITTSTFSKEAIDYVESLKDMKIILIDKDKLLEYMLKYNIGVQVKETIEIKKVDEDYFEE